MAEDESNSSMSTSITQRNMKLKLEQWKQEKAAKAAQERAAKSHKPQPFRVPCTTSSPLRGGRAAVSSENSVQCAPPQAKTPLKGHAPANRTALTERCPNTEQLSTGSLRNPRSVSPPLGRYNPPQRSLRSKTPEPMRTPRGAKTPEHRRAPKTPEPRHAQQAAKPAQPQAMPQQPAGDSVYPLAMDSNGEAPGESEVPQEAPACSVDEKQIVVMEALPAVVASQGTLEESGIEATCKSSEFDENLDLAATTARLEESWEIGAVATSLSPPPPLPCCGAPPAPEAPPPELRVEELPGRKSYEESFDGSVEASAEEEKAEQQAAASSTGAGLDNTEAVVTAAEGISEPVLADGVADANAAARAEAHARAVTTSEPVVETVLADAVEPEASSPKAGGSTLSAYLPAAPCSPPTLPKSGNLLAAYLPASSPCGVTSPSAAVRVGGGLMAAYEERAALPKMPPPSPATPSAHLAFALATASKMPDLANVHAAEFARAAGAALVRLAAEDITPCHGRDITMPAEPGSPAAHPPAEEAGSPLSPLSLESGSPEVVRQEDVREVKLEA